MLDNTIINSELKDLMDQVSKLYSKEEIDWYLSLVPKLTIENIVEIKVSSNTYANEK